MKQIAEWELCSDNKLQSKLLCLSFSFALSGLLFAFIQY